MSYCLLTQDISNFVELLIEHWFTYQSLQNLTRKTIIEMIIVKKLTEIGYTIFLYHLFHFKPILEFEGMTQKIK